MRLTFDKAHDLNALHDELLAAGISPDLVEGDGSKLALVVADDADDAAIQAVVDAHSRGGAGRRRAMRGLRYERNRRLAATDWTQLADVPPATHDLWQPYRQQLRDLPATVTDPLNPDWPTPPGPVELQPL